MNVAIFHGSGLFTGDWLNWNRFISQIVTRLNFSSWLPQVASASKIDRQKSARRSLQVVAALMPIQEREMGTI
jgi:hypothetical protein